MKGSTLVILSLILYSCNSDVNEKIIIDSKNKIRNVEIVENDTTKTIISIRNGKIESISRYLNNKMNGEQLKFYENGNLAKKIEASGGNKKGYNYEFYPSGSILSYNFYCEIYPCYYGVEYWNGPLNTLKKSIHYGKKGEIYKIRLFDSLGYFIKDTLPF